MGVTGQVRASLYNLLLYGEGGKFKKHRDSDKELGLFGTLVIALPSAHGGGALAVHHGGETLSSSTGVGVGAQACRRGTSRSMPPASTSCCR